MNIPNTSTLFTLFLIGCGAGNNIGLNPNAEDSNNDGWWNDTGSTAPDNDNSSEDEDEEGDFEGDEDEEGDEEDEGREGDEDEDFEDEEGEEGEEGDDHLAGVWFGGELSLTSGLGFFAYYTATKSRIGCELEYPTTAVESSSRCTACSQTFEVLLGEGETFVDDGSSCAASGYLGLDNKTIGVGISGETLYLDIGSGFEQITGGEAVAESGELFFEFERLEESDEEE